MEYDYLDFNIDDFPQEFEHDFNGVSFTLKIYYNRVGDSFHIDIKDEYGVDIVLGEKLVYGQALWMSVNDQRLPVVVLTPIDEDGEETEVSALNFPVRVKLAFLGEEQNDDIVVDNDDLALTDESDEETDDADDSTDADMNLYGNDSTVGGERG
ncbi:hypothetical protein LOSG293_110190 [Secundilactobacillus oryzae JCM 18671]|uniref:Cyanophage baseplate Pam3 plug gp18 domain-containing protein n=1 Tax=Secundilactobacillus oryzae JCM 18671 TaxID=1291743 RepID=A0A081BI35_9LACO|nr:hypothetical protein [Secundilactobacillus oryzae]GAK47703.1 hypothetical protein LOSG293_110190 [Secundilactobacillus oryzae JCM 18671]